VGLVVVACIVIGLVLTGSSKPAMRTGASTTTTTTTTGLHQTAVAPGHDNAVPAATLTATLTTDAPRSASPGGPVVGTVAATWYGRPSILPVVAQQAGYLDVRVQPRPNGQTAWIPTSDATLGSTPYVIVIHLSSKRLDLYQQGKLVLSAPAGIGTDQYPTPTGPFFVAFFAAPPSPGYGPFVIVTSGHSNTISDWEESGDALMAIHGPLGADAEIGTSGAQVSHGCVRLHVPDLEQLRPVPPGTPVDVVDQ
jgi:lipoprotein-anchoring transpeptidase ErfK/SrfK